MRRNMDWLDELDEVELDVDQSESDVLYADAEPPDHGALSARSARSAISDDEPDALDDFDAELDPEDLPDEGEFDAATQYFHESARHPLLSVERERTLTRAVEQGRMAEQILAQPCRSPSSATQRRLRRDIALAHTGSDRGNRAEN